MLSSEQSSAMSTKFLGQMALTIAHIVISMNSINSPHVLKKKKKGQIIKTLTLKQK
jgi:hypothetical protein